MEYTVKMSIHPSVRCRVRNLYLDFEFTFYLIGVSFNLRLVLIFLLLFLLEFFLDLGKEMMLINCWKREPFFFIEWFNIQNQNECYIQHNVPWALSTKQPIENLNILN